MQSYIEIVCAFSSVFTAGYISFMSYKIFKNLKEEINEREKENMRNIIGIVKI